MDFLVENHFTLFMLTPMTLPARQWVSQHLPQDVTVLGDSIAVEHRYITDIVDGIRQDGLTVGPTTGH